MAQARMEQVAFAGGAGEIVGWFAEPAVAGRHAALALLHGRNGPTEGFRKVALRFAEEGFAALGVNYMTRAENPSLEDMLRSIGGALDFLRSRPSVNGEQIAVGGYCKGGGLTYQALANFPGYSAGIVWHGGLAADNVAAALRVQAPLLILHGASDTPVPIDQVYDLTKRLNNQGQRFELKVYHSCDHAFTLPDGDRYVAEAADDAFREAVLFLRRKYQIPLGAVDPLVKTTAAT
jgi:carboxymethylenebutenolidase